ncbi:hypothetical protein L7F22_055686 [Adiantum nelumboides]|nr:hypothetical protein [Adiantum nelumboides]
MVRYSHNRVRNERRDFQVLGRRRKINVIMPAVLAALIVLCVGTLILEVAVSLGCKRLMRDGPTVAELLDFAVRRRRQPPPPPPVSASEAARCRHCRNPFRWRPHIAAALPSKAYVAGAGPAAANNSSGGSKGSEAELDERLCCVCLEGFEKGLSIRMLPLCKHSFHSACIDTWLLEARPRTKSCPYCRSPVKSCQRRVGK